MIQNVRCLGFALDSEANSMVGKKCGIVVDIGEGGTDGNKVLVCRTDEQVSAR